MTLTPEDIVNAFRHFATFNVSRDGPPQGEPSGMAKSLERR